MRSPTRASAWLITCSAALAQTQYFLTPSAFNLAEGNIEVFSSQPFYAANARFQYLDGTQAPTSAKTLKSVELRRRATEVPGPYPARSTNLIVVLAHTTLTSATTTFTANYKGASTVTFSGSFNLPDLSAGPTTPPAPWSILIPYKTPFAYNGTDDLLLELQCQGTSPVGQYYPLDTVDGAFVPGGYGIYNGYEPCQVTGHAQPFYIWRHNDPVINAGIVSYDMYAVDGPASQPAVWNLGTTQSYTNLGGTLCAHLQPAPQIMIGMMTDAVGNIGSPMTPVTLSYRYPGVVHQVFAQFAALDSGQATAIKVALSDDIKFTVGDTGPYKVKRLATTTGNLASTGGLTSDYVPILRHGY